MPPSLDFYSWPTPNCWKVAILLEELGLDYRLCPIDIGAGDQFSEAFTAISPNQRVPAIVDHAVEGAPQALFESGAILLYLAEKQARFLPSDPRGRAACLEWCFWQVGNLGPMAGQHSHFFNYAPEAEQASYAAKRYRAEYQRCLQVLERRLTAQDWLAGEAYSIADMIAWPWVLIAKAMGVPLEPYPKVTAWRQRIKERPAVQRAVNLQKGKARQGPLEPEVRTALFKQPDGETA
ncbi:MAG: glutathione S-transferase N-terminal domain-containing protein [Pseudomonadota bacterium]